VVVKDPLEIGILALQGDFAAHARAFEREGCLVREVRSPREMGRIDGLVLPGGETTTLIKLIHRNGLWDVIRRAPANRCPLYGTCAGMILLAQEVIDPVQESLGLLPIRVRRNGYGRQVDSFVAAGQVRVPSDLADPKGPSTISAVDLIFIRAPVIDEILGSVEVLARHDGVPILVRKGGVLAGSFHPELSDQGIVERIFLAMVRRARGERPGGNGGG